MFLFQNLFYSHILYDSNEVFLYNSNKHLKTIAHSYRCLSKIPASDNWRLAEEGLPMTDDVTFLVSSLMSWELPQPSLIKHYGVSDPPEWLYNNLCGWLWTRQPDFAQCKSIPHAYSMSCYLIIHIQHGNTFFYQDCRYKILWFYDFFVENMVILLFFLFVFRFLCEIKLNKFKVISC